MKGAAASQLVFIPSPGMGHLIPTVEMAKQLVGRDHRLSITVLIMKLPSDKSKVSSYTQSLLLKETKDRLKFVYLPEDEIEVEELQSKSNRNFISEFIDMNKKHVRDHVKKIVSTESESDRLSGFVIDLFCTTMMDVAAEFGVPSYVFFTSSAAGLSFVLHLETLNREHNLYNIEFKESDAELAVPGFVNPVPVKVMPSVLTEKESNMLTIAGKRLREAKGIMVNTFAELEPHAVSSLVEDDNVPPVYPVGPVIDLAKDKNEEDEEAIKIMRWLDHQPQSSAGADAACDQGGHMPPWNFFPYYESLPQIPVTLLFLPFVWWWGISHLLIGGGGGEKKLGLLDFGIWLLGSCFVC